MKLFFDANLSPVLVGRLTDICPGSEHVMTSGLEASDTAVWEHA